MPGLSGFIRKNVEPILVEWESFARSLPQGETMDIVALRDHAREMLVAIADDLDEPQSDAEQTGKSRGESDAGEGTAHTAAQAHGAGRAQSGFTVGDMVAEFRALRASVMLLWSKSGRDIQADDLIQMTRFNEAIDQAIAESIIQYTQNVGDSKERFLAILGHDLRTPLGAIITSTRFMLDTAEESGNLPQPYSSLVDSISRSARRMNQLVADLLEFARVSFGDSMPVQRTPMDLGQLARDVVGEVRASYPGCEFQEEISGDLRGEWDGDRLFQALTNLLSNAVQHGAKGEPIRVTARVEGDDCIVSVQNRGRTIPPEQVERLFSGMNQHPTHDAGDRRHLGLGLYIVDKIVTAHGGGIDVRSSDEKGTIFALRLPRSMPHEEPTGEPIRARKKS
jgi:signal transduction histidine kinase